MVVALAEIDGLADGTRIDVAPVENGALPDNGGILVALAEMEGLVDGSELYETAVPMVPTTELAEYEILELGNGYGP